jgi:sugar lactone lactonase YvrE
VLRFPQAVAIGPEGHVYVGDQSSRIIQVFTQDGRFVRQFGTPGRRPGQITAISSITVAPNGTVAVTDGGTNRVVLYKGDGGIFGSIGGKGSGVGQFRFGAGGGNDAPAGGAITFSRGYFYISDSGNDRVQRMLLDGTEQQIFIDTGQLSHPRGLAVRGDHLVIADDHNHRLAVFRTDGTFVKSVGRGQGAGPGQLNFPFGVAFDQAGRVFVADDINQRVVRFSTPPKYKYKARWGSYGTGPGKLAYPRAITTDAQGRVYVTNTGNDRIDVFSNTGKVLSSFGRSGRSSGQFNTPGGVATDASGIRAVADTVNGRVQLLNPDGSVASIWGSPNPGPTILKRPIDVTFDAAGNGFVLDQRTARITKFDRASALPTIKFGGIGTGPGRMLDPSAITTAPDGTLLVADTGNTRIARFSQAGRYLGSYRTPEAPRGIAVSPDGSRTYVTTTRNQVKVFDAAGTAIGRYGYGPGKKLRQLNAPAGISVDASGGLWVAERGGSRISHYSPDGKKLGVFGERGSGDGAQFSGPSGVAVSCDGVLTVTDTRNNVVRAFALGTAPAGSTCRALPTPGQPPLLQYPTLPDPEGPLVTARSLRRTQLLRRNVALSAGCDTTCTLEVSGTVSQRGLPPKRKGVKRRPVAIKLRSVKVKIEGGSTRVVRLRTTAPDRRKLRRALAGKRGVDVSISMTATGSVGEPSTNDLRIIGTY